MSWKRWDNAKRLAFNNDRYRYILKELMNLIKLWHWFQENLSDKDKVAFYWGHYFEQVQNIFLTINSIHYLMALEL